MKTQSINIIHKSSCVPHAEPTQDYNLKWVLLWTH